MIKIMHSDLLLICLIQDSEVLEDMEAGPSGVQLQEPPYVSTQNIKRAAGL